MTKRPTSAPPIPEYSHRLRPKTYSVAVYLVGAVFLLQVIMFISIFWLRAMVVPVNVRAPKASPALAASPSSTQPAVSPSAEIPSLELTPTHPTLLNVPTAADRNTQIQSLADQAKVLAHQNDLHAAMDLLIKAEDIDPRYPNTLKSLAETSYLLNNPVQAKIYWQRLVDLGPSVGTVYAVARDQVLLLNSSHEADSLRGTSTLPRDIYISEVQKTPVQTVNGLPQFHVRPILMRKNFDMPNFDQKKLRPFVIFYQQMKDGSLTPDLNQRKGAFEDTFLFWNKKLKEAFGVDYIMPLPGTPNPDKTVAGEYYGFVIGIYYDNILQDARSEPSDLLARMPLPAAIE